MEVNMAGFEAPLMVAWELTGEGKEKGKQKRGKGGGLGGGRYGGALQGHAQLLREYLLAALLPVHMREKATGGRRKRERQKKRKGRKKKEKM
jgi:hypothetical protein